MKAVVILTVLVLVLQLEARSILRLKRSIGNPDAESCIGSLNLDAQEIVEISNMDYAPEDHRNFITFMNCLWTKKGYLDKDGNINTNKIRNMIVDIFSENSSHSTSYATLLAEGTISKCQNIQGESPGQKAIKMENCVVRNLRKVVLDE